MMVRHRTVRCSFCDRTEREVNKLAAGPDVYICDACVAAAARAMNDASGEDAVRPVVEPAPRGRPVGRLRTAIGRIGKGPRLKASGVRR
jgi:hypothetical protein